MIQKQGPSIVDTRGPAVAQRLPPLYRMFGNVTTDYSGGLISRYGKILISDHEEIKYCQEDVVRERFNLTYIASN